MIMKKYIFYVLVILCGVILGANSGISSFFHQGREAVFYETFKNNLEKISRVFPLNEKGETVVLFYQSFGGKCSASEALNLLSSEKNTEQKVLLAVDSSFREHDVRNLKTNFNYTFDTTILPEDLSSIWINTVEEKHMVFDGVAMVFVNGKFSKVVDLGNVKSMSNYFNLNQ